MTIERIDSIGRIDGIDVYGERVTRKRNPSPRRGRGEILKGEKTVLILDND